MPRFAQAILWSGVLWMCVGAEAQRSKDYIIAARRTGAIEFIDPATLKTLSSIRVDVASSSTGLNGVFADPDGRTIYIEGPIGASAAGANNCCWLYSIDLATMQTKVVAGIWGTRSRRAFISPGRGLMQRVSPAVASAIEKAEGDRWQASPDGRWWFGLRNGPALELYDVARREIVRSYAATSSDEPELSNGTWLGNRFYVYATSHGSGRLWTVTPESTGLGEGVSVPELGQVPGCTRDALTDVTAAGDRLLLHEVFGSKIDRRDRCDDVPGGAWVMDPAEPRLAVQVAPDLHFWMLIPNRGGSEFYGITSEVPETQSPAQLVRVDARNGNVLRYRSLESDYWWITTAPLGSMPSGDVSVRLATDLTR